MLGERERVGVALSVWLKVSVGLPETLGVREREGLGVRLPVTDREVLALTLGEAVPPAPAAAPEEAVGDRLPVWV